MAKKFAILTPEEYNQLCNLDYKDLYSLRHGVNYNKIGKQLEIFCSINRYGKLYINVNFYPEGHKTFDFDELERAIIWTKRHVEVNENVV